MTVAPRDNHSEVLNIVVKLSTDDWCVVNLDRLLKDLGDTEPEVFPSLKYSAISLISLPSTSPASFTSIALTYKQT